MTGWDLRHGDFRDVLEGETCDVLVTDPPYHVDVVSGHNAGTTQAADGERSKLSYDGWDEDDARAFIDIWVERVRGWMVIFSDHMLAEVYRKHMKHHGRYAFAPIPAISPGSRVRHCGDGPSSYSDWIVVSRPRKLPYARWGTLPGHYEAKPERNKLVKGGKPLNLMAAVVDDYSRPGDLVCDPCAGGATTLVAAVSLRRRALGAEVRDEAYADGRRRLELGFNFALPFDDAAFVSAARQQGLFDV